MRVDAIAERTEGPSLALTVTRGMGSAFSVGGLNRPPPLNSPTPIQLNLCHGPSKCLKPVVSVFVRFEAMGGLRGAVVETNATCGRPLPGMYHPPYIRSCSPVTSARYSDELTGGSWW